MHRCRVLIKLPDIHYHSDIDLNEFLPKAELTIVSDILLSSFNYISDRTISSGVKTLSFSPTSS